MGRRFSPFARVATKMGRVVALLLGVSACATAAGRGGGAPGGGEGGRRWVAMGGIEPGRVEAVVAELVERHGKGQEERIRRSVRQVALFWREEDGTAEDFAAFCREQYLADESLRTATLDRFEGNLEAVSGHAVALTRTLREPTDLDLGDPLPVDLLFATLNPFDHFSEDAFRTRVAFVALLNFPLYGLEELTRLGPGLDRRGWAEARLTQGFSLRVPGSVRAEVTRAYARADDYIANYNLYLHNLLASDGTRPFPEGLKLISHWGLRDHIKAMYSDPSGNLERQRLLQLVMERIVRQEIPAAVIDNPDVDWEPVANRVVCRAGGATAAASCDGAPEPDRRYAHWLEVFRAEHGVDAYSPAYPTFIARRFNLEREIPEETVRALLEAVLTAPVARDVAALIRKRLGRPLEGFDIWYDGFKARRQIPEAELDRAVASRYPDLRAFQADLPGILRRLGFSEDTARFLASKIVVDPARGAGHALGAGMRSDSAHLRTRVPRGGMDYKGYNIALHELGHNVEQVFSLNRVDRTLLSGVPNTAFTEAMAFLFQVRDLDVLGMTAGQNEETRAMARALRALDTYWMTFEIAGVALLDMAAWHYLYDHPDATPAQFREAVVSSAVDIWNRYYAPVLGVGDTPLLAIYSHTINSGLYLPDYPIGHLIDFQIERFVEGKSLAVEMERMCTLGRLTPDVWMRKAVGAPLSAEPLLEAAREALTRVAGE